MKKPVKTDGTYDGRSKEGRQSEGKTITPKTTEKKFEKALKNGNKQGKNL